MSEIFFSVDGWQVLAVMVKALTYGATFFAAGGTLFLVLFATLLDDATRASMPMTLYRVAWLAIGLSVLRLVVMNGMLGGAWVSMFDVDLARTVLQSREGTATGARVFGLLSLIAQFKTPGSAWSKSLALLGASMAVASFGWVGHASELSGRGVLPQILITMHLAAMGYWLGALWPLHCIVHGNDQRRSAAIVRRFGHIALYVVTALLSAGGVLLWLLLGNIGALLHSAYGQLMLTKLLTVAVLLGVAAYNKLHLTPRLLHGDRSALQQLRYSVRVEMILACIILLVTAAFTTLTGPGASA